MDQCDGRSAVLPAPHKPCNVLACSYVKQPRRMLSERSHNPGKPAYSVCILFENKMEEDTYQMGYDLGRHRKTTSLLIRYTYNSITYFFILLAFQAPFSATDWGSADDIFTGWRRAYFAVSDCSSCKRANPLFASICIYNQSR